MKSPTAYSVTNDVPTPVTVVEPIEIDAVPDVATEEIALCVGTTIRSLLWFVDRVPVYGNV